MQPPTEHIRTVPRRPTHGPRGDEAELYRRHHRDLERSVARVVNAPHQLIEDACQTAWAILLRNQPDRYAIFSWLRIVAIHEAYRLSAITRRDAHLDGLSAENRDWHEFTADPRSLDSLIEAREALRLLASLPDRERNDLALLIAGYSYRQIAEITGGRTFTNVNKHLAKARARIRLARRHGTATPPPGRAEGPKIAAAALYE